MDLTPGPTNKPVTVWTSVALGRRLAARPELSPYGVVREKKRKTRKKPTLLKT